MTNPQTAAGFRKPSRKEADWAEQALREDTVDQITIMRNQLLPKSSLSVFESMFRFLIRHLIPSRRVPMLYPDIADYSYTAALYLSEVRVKLCRKGSIQPRLAELAQLPEADAVVIRADFIVELGRATAYRGSPYLTAALFLKTGLHRLCEDQDG